MTSVAEGMTLAVVIGDMKMRDAESRRAVAQGSLQLKNFLLHLAPED